MLLFPLLLACQSQTSISTVDASPSSDANTSLNLQVPQPTGADFEIWQGVISTKPTLTMAMVEADGKYHTWMEGRSGVLRTDPKTSFWLEQGGLSTTAGKGQLHMEIDGHSYYTASATSTIPAQDKLSNPPKNTSSYAISLEMTSKGKYITSLTQKDARPVRLASTVQKPSRSAILEVQNPVGSLGTPTPALSAEQLQILKDQNGKLDTLSGSKPLPIVAPTPENLAKWNTELKGIFGSIANISWSTMVNLDSDEGMEALLCSPTPQGNTCFVYDEVKAQGRYYETAFKWTTGHMPMMFTLNEKVYIYHNAPLKKGAVHKLLTFTGSGYHTTQL